MRTAEPSVDQHTSVHQRARAIRDCQQCGSPIADESVTCPDCGYTLASSAIVPTPANPVSDTPGAQTVCENCGRRVPCASVVCPSCGNPPGLNITEHTSIHPSHHYPAGLLAWVGGVVLIVVALTAFPGPLGTVALLLAGLGSLVIGTRL
jgi:RNA polymerase subunit RPABC4/transcription elongation factor Spt4